MENKNTEDWKECTLNGCLFFSSVKLARAFGKIAEDAFQPTGFAPSYALLLYNVNKRGEMQQKEIGKLLHLTPSTITRFIEKLENKKLVERKNDGKNVTICATEKGLLLQPAIEEAWTDLHERYASVLTVEERKQFVGLAEKLLTAFEE